MKEQKVIITQSAEEINGYINLGWVVKSITAQHVAASPSTGYHATSFQAKGNFCFLLERENKL